MSSRIVPRAGRKESDAVVKRGRAPRVRSGRSRARGRVVPPSVAQVAALAGEGPETLRGMVLVAAYTGLRLFEVAALTPDDVLDGPRVRVRVGKGGYRDEVSVMFEPAVAAFAAAANSAAAGALVFRTPVGGMVTRQWVAREFGRAAAAVGYVGTFHALRHFHAVWLIDQGASDIDVAAQLRHHDNGQLVRSRYGWYRAQSAALARIQKLG